MPKTGGTFITKILKDALRNKRLLTAQQTKDFWYRTRLKWPKYQLYTKKKSIYNGDMNKPTPHNFGNNLPQKYHHLDIVGSVRNPFDWYVSAYEFKYKNPTSHSFFKKQPKVNAICKERYANFPELSFAESIDFLQNIFTPAQIKAADINKGINIGFYDLQFIKFFAKNPRQMIQKYNADYIASKEYQQDLFDVHFLQQEQLNDGLYQLLLKYDYAAESIEYIKNHQRILPHQRGREQHQKWEQYYTPSLKETIKNSDKMIFDLFPHYLSPSQLATETNNSYTSQLA